MNANGKNRGRHEVQDALDDEYILLSDREPRIRKGEATATNIRLLWEHRRFLRKFTLYSFLAIALIAFLIPSRFKSTARLMPPDSNQAASGLAAVAAMVSSTAGSTAGGVANEMFGLKNTSDIFSG